MSGACRTARRARRSARNARATGFAAQRKTAARDVTGPAGGDAFVGTVTPGATARRRYPPAAGCAVALVDARARRGGRWDWNPHNARTRGPRVAVRGSSEQRRSVRMPFTYTIDRESQLVSVVVSGHVTSEEALQAFDAIVSDPEFVPGMDVMSDHRQMETVLPVGFVSALINRVRGAGDLMAGTRWAMVEARAASYGMAMMASALAASMPVEIRAFRDPEEARAWLAGGP